MPQKPEHDTGMNSTTNELSIAFIGDVYVGDTPSLRLDESVAELFATADLVVANQEGPITDSVESVGGKACLKSDPRTAKLLRDWGVGVVSLANNHMFDFGWGGFEQTCRVLDEVGILYLGAGKNVSQAARPYLFEVNGVSVAIIACAAEYTQATCATEDTFGCAPLEEPLVLKAVRDIESEVDVLIVVPHWGYCDYALPTPEQVTLAERMLDAGATAVVGHHSHIVHGLIERRNRLVCFSLGNFAFNPFIDRGRQVNLTKENLKGAVLTLRLGKSGIISHSVQHTVKRDDRIELDGSARRERVFTARSVPLGAADYAGCWRRYVRRRMIMRMIHWANPLQWRKIRATTLIAGWLMLKQMLKRPG